MNTLNEHPREDRSTSFGVPGLASTQYYDYPTEREKLPLMVIYMGNNIWKPENFWKRTSNQFFSVEYVSAGDALFIQNQRRYLIEPDQVFLVQKNAANEYRTGPSGFLHKRYMVVTGPLLEPVLSDTGLIAVDRVTPADPQRIKALLKSGFDLLKRREPDFAVRLSTLAYELLLELARGTDAERMPEMIRNAVHFMHRNVTRMIANRELAAMANLSVPHFNRLFRAVLGASPGAYMQRVRMAYAAHRLETTSLNVKELAYELGYQNPFSFSLQFKKVIGRSPRHYRMQH